MRHGYYVAILFGEILSERIGRRKDALAALEGYAECGYGKWLELFHLTADGTYSQIASVQSAPLSEEYK